MQMYGSSESMLLTLSDPVPRPHPGTPREQIIASKSFQAQKRLNIIR